MRTTISIENRQLMFGLKQEGHKGRNEFADKAPKELSGIKKKVALI